MCILLCFNFEFTVFFNVSLILYFFHSVDCSRVSLVIRVDSLK